MFETVGVAGCSDCLCRDCLMWWSSRCPYGECFDDLRAAVNPYDAAHPHEQPRRTWTNWRTDQAYWCRGGITYPVHACEYFVEYTGSKVKSCILANVQVFQDGYISCSLVSSHGCEHCYKHLETACMKEE